MVVDYSNGAGMLHVLALSSRTASPLNPTVEFMMRDTDIFSSLPSSPFTLYIYIYIYPKERSALANGAQVAHERLFVRHKRAHCSQCMRLKGRGLEIPLKI